MTIDDYWWLLMTIDGCWGFWRRTHPPTDGQRWFLSRYRDWKLEEILVWSKWKQMMIFREIGQFLKAGLILSTYSVWDKISSSSWYLHQNYQFSLHQTVIVAMSDLINLSVSSLLFSSRTQNVNQTTLLDSALLSKRWIGSSLIDIFVKKIIF